MIAKSKGYDQANCKINKNYQETNERHFKLIDLQSQTD